MICDVFFLFRGTTLGGGGGGSVFTNQFYNLFDFYEQSTKIEIYDFKLLQTQNCSVQYHMSDMLIVSS